MTAAFWAQSTDVARADLSVVGMAYYNCLLYVLLDVSHMAARCCCPVSGIQDLKITQGTRSRL
jgi:hypothetical protein